MSAISPTSTRLLDAAGGARDRRATPTNSAATLAALFADPGRLRAMARAAAKAVEAQGGAADRVMRAIAPLSAGRRAAGGGMIAPRFWARERARPRRARR